MRLSRERTTVRETMGSGLLRRRRGRASCRRAAPTTAPPQGCAPRPDPGPSAHRCYSDGLGSSSDKLGPERDKTDEGLRTERRNADRALSDRQAAVEEDADSVVRHARRIADAVLVAAREKADERLRPTASVVDARATVAAERAIEDGTLRDERAIADETLRQERMETARALARL